MKNHLPPHWSWKKLGEVSRIVYGKGLPTKQLKTSGFPVFGANGIIGYNDNYLYQDSQVLISCRGAYSGKINFSPPKCFVTNNSLILESDDTSISKRFLFYSLQSVNKSKLVTGTAQPQVTINNVVELSFPVPPLPEQYRIVAKIESLFSELDKGIENLKTAQQQLKVYRQAVLKWAFEGKLTEEWRRKKLNGKSKVIQAEAGQQQSMAAEPEEEYVRIKGLEHTLPEGWEQVKTNDVIETINNGYTPTKEFLFEGSGEVPFIKVYNLNFDGTINFKKNPTFIPKAIHDTKLKRSTCYPGDILINIVGPPLGKVSVVSNQFPEWNINQAIVLFRPNKNVLSKYISYFMQNPVTIHWLEETSKATAGQWNVKVSTCREIPFPYCSPIEQRQIVSEIESRLSVCDKLESTMEENLRQAEALRQSILKKAFEGRLI